MNWRGGHGRDWREKKGKDGINILIFKFKKIKKK